MAGTSASEAQRETILGRLADIETVLAGEFSHESYAHRYAAVRKAIDVIKAGIDALYLGSSTPEETARTLGVKASAETQGQAPEDVNVAKRGGYEPPLGPDLPEYADASTMVPAGGALTQNDPAQAAPDNLATDPKAREGDQTTGTGGSGAGKEK